MMLLMLAMALQEDAGALERRVDALEKQRKELSRKIDEALEKGQGDEAVKLKEDQKKAEQELKEARGKLDALRDRGGIGIGAQAMLTHWDNDLELDDGFGWSARLSVIPVLAFEYARWDGEDEESGEDARVQAYRLVAGASRNVLKDVEGDLSVSAGLIHFSSETPGVDGDTGPCAGLQGRALWKLGERAVFSLGGAVDAFRTDFQQEETHTAFACSATAGLELRF